MYNKTTLPVPKILWTWLCRIGQIPLPRPAERGIENNNHHKITKAGNFLVLCFTLYIAQDFMITETLCPMERIVEYAFDLQLIRSFISISHHADIMYLC